MIIGLIIAAWSVAAIVAMTYKVEEGSEPKWLYLVAAPLLPVALVLGLIPAFNRHQPNAINF